MNQSKYSAQVDTDVSVLLLGAGSSTRMNGLSKVFMSFGNETLLERAVRVARTVADDIVVGLAPADISRGQELIGSSAKLVAGGASRQETIEHLVNAAEGSVLVVHDVARPFATSEIYREILRHVPTHSACVPAIGVPVRDSLCRNNNGFVDVMVDRKDLMAIQTPQAFNAEDLRALLMQAKHAGQDETSLVALFNKAGHPVKLVEGDPENTKITYPSDIPQRYSDSNTIQIETI